MSEDSAYGARARDLQFDALMHEAAGVLPAPGLSDRITAAIAAVGTPASASLCDRSSLWLAAAAVVLGLGVTGWFGLRDRDAGSSSDTARDGAPAVQEPQKQEPQKQEPAPAPKVKRTVTLIADYSENSVVELNDQGKEVFRLDEVFGAWDAELTPDGNILLTEFSVSRVREVDHKGNTTWSFEDLKNPYDADVLPNGNILIADTFGSRVIEVKPDRLAGTGGEIVWSYGDKNTVRPFDADRLPNGNTLIADVLKDRVIEVDAQGVVVWERKELPNVHDADRLANGNTLVTLRNRGAVVEIDKDGKIVWTIEGLSSPSDADRLPNGNTLVAENRQVREFDKDGKEVWKHETVWAVEVNRYEIR